MNIRFAAEKDIPQMIDLLRQVGEVHHQIRPDLFRAGAQKYDETALKKLLADKTRAIIAGVILQPWLQHMQAARLTRLRCDQTAFCHPGQVVVHGRTGLEADSITDFSDGGTEAPHGGKLPNKVQNLIRFAVIHIS